MNIKKTISAPPAMHRVALRSGFLLLAASAYFFNANAAFAVLMGAPSFVGAPDSSSVSSSQNTATSTSQSGTTGTAEAESGPKDAFMGCKEDSPSIEFISPADGANLSGNFDVVAKAHMKKCPNGMIIPFRTVVFSNNGTTLGSTIPESRQTYFSYLKCADGSGDWCATVHFAQISEGDNTVTFAGDGYSGEMARATLHIKNAPVPKSIDSSAPAACGGKTLGCLSYSTTCSASYINDPYHYVKYASGMIKLKPGKYLFVRTDPKSWRILHKDKFTIKAGQTTTLVTGGCN